MEGQFVKGLAEGWMQNCYGSNDVVFSQEVRDVHGGKSAQRVTCTHFLSGGVQFHSSDIAVEKGKPYTLMLWMKGDVKTPVYVGIRKHGEPYTTYLKRDLRVRNDWSPYLIMGEASESDPRCGIYIMFTGIGTLLVDDVSLMPGIREDPIVESGWPPQKGNRIYNSGFEAGPEGWTPVGGFALDDKEAHSGRSSARLEAAELESVTAPINRASRPQASSAGPFRCGPASATRSPLGSRPPRRTRASTCGSSSGLTRGAIRRKTATNAHARSPRRRSGRAINSAASYYRIFGRAT
jgi:hypothetical protein